MATSSFNIGELNSDIAALNSKVTDGYRGIAYLVGTTNGSTAIPAGSFVYVNNNGNGVADGLYTASEAIGAYYQITTSRVTAVPVGGGLNALNSNCVTKLSYDTSSATTIDLTDSQYNRTLWFIVSGNGGMTILTLWTGSSVLQTIKEHTTITISTSGTNNRVITITPSSATIFSLVRVV